VVQADVLESLYPAAPRGGRFYPEVENECAMALNIVGPSRPAGHRIIERIRARAGAKPALRHLPFETQLQGPAQKAWDVRNGLISEPGLG
jgi:hypothetical protein